LDGSSASRSMARTASGGGTAPSDHSRQTMCSSSPQSRRPSAARRACATSYQGNSSGRAATRSPIALAVTLEAVRRAAKLDTLDDVLTQDYRVSCASLRSHDLVEGIRAQLIDKDRNPQWSPASLAQVSAADVDAYFAPVDDDLTF